MNRLYPLFFSVLFPLVGFSQCYDVVQRPYYPYPFDQGTLVPIDRDDTTSHIIDMEFDFCFFGDTVNQFVIASNGYVTFDTSYANQDIGWQIGGAIPDSTLEPRFAILAPWQDMNPGAGNYGIFYSIHGTEPFRRLVISYYRISMFSCTNLDFSNQVVIYESLNAIDINIMSKPLCSTWNGGAAIEGIVNQDGTQGLTVLGRNFPTQWSAHNDSYRFVPICDCPTSDNEPSYFANGLVYEDENLNCEFDSIESTIPFVRLELQPGNGTFWTNINGEFGVQLDIGEYTISQSSNNPFHLDYVCSGDPIPVTIHPDSIEPVLHLGDTIIPYTDIRFSMGSTQFPLCFDAYQNFEICNLGNTTAFDIDVGILIQNSQLELNLTSLPWINSIGDSILSFTIDSLPSNSCFEFTLTDSVICDSSAINEIICFHGEVEAQANEPDIINNNYTFCGFVGTSYDPNYITVKGQRPEERWRFQEDITNTDTLEYKIEFQNTGIAPAYTVRIDDHLPPNVDPESIVPIIASHDYFMQYVDSVLTFNFVGIALPDSASDPIGSKGYVVYRVLQTPNNQPGTIIENQAEIFFDFNAPVITNTTQNVIIDYSGIDEYQISSLILYPNPTTGEIFISNSDLTNAITSIEVFDLQGRFLLKETGNNLTSVNLGTFNKGVYLFQIQTKKGTVVKRVIKN